ncbi:MAG TPA: tail fiber domain-containing protein [Verrucomicrobiae bacterium]
MNKPSAIILCLTLLGLTASNAAPLGTAFTYQGRLSHGTNAADGRYDLTFTLYDASLAGNALAGPITNGATAVTDGYFMAVLDFRADVFGKDARWLEIGVRTNRSFPFTTLSPRQRLTPAPQAFYASDAGNAVTLDGQSSSAYAPASGLSNYVAKAGDTMTGLLVLEGSQTLAHARGPNTAGSWLSLENTDTGGKRWDFISTGSANGGGAGNLLFRQAVVGSVLTLTPAGRAGVGTVGPLGKLDVVDDAGTEPMLLRGSSSRTTGTWLALKNTDAGGSQWNLISTGSGSSGGAGNLLFRESVAGGSALTLTPAGRVGVGTLSPITKLGVVDEAGTEGTLIRASSSRTAGSWLALVNTDTGGKRWDVISTGSGNSGGAGNLAFRQDAVGHVMTLTPEGRVGVGTDSPTNKLVVAGDPDGDEVVLKVRGNHMFSTALSLENGTNRWDIQSCGPIGYGGTDSFAISRWPIGPVLSLNMNRRVGINRTSPEATLDIVTSENVPALRLQSVFQPNGWATMQMVEGNGHSAQLTAWYGTDPAGWWTPPAVHTGFYMNNGDYFYMRGDGNGAVCNQRIRALFFIESSDRNAKTRVEPVNSGDVLERVLSLPVSTWVFTNRLDETHMGPMAQDFHAAFGLGTDDKHITTVDVDGVALAAIQGLNQKLEDRGQRSEVRSQRAEESIRSLEAENTELKQRLAALEGLVNKLSTKGN